MTRSRGRASQRALLACWAALTVAGCSRPSAPSAPVLELPGKPRPAVVESGDERRQVRVLPFGGWSWEGTLPPRALFAVGVQLVPLAGEAPAELAVEAELVIGDEREILDLARSRDGRWLDLAADLSRHAGERGRIEVTPFLASTPAAGRELAWSGDGITERPAAAPERPNVLFVLVDTLRADHLTPYGYERPTSPMIEAELARRGVVVETAYSQAPWTVPSVASFMTGRYPGEILSGPMEGYALPEHAETLAERLGVLGYDTAAYFGNFVLRDANGFGRGFKTRYTPPARPESNLLHADSVNARAIPWLKSHQHQPFFLYVHYMDPHDPYDSPENVGGKSPFYPDYPGTLSGLLVHGVYTGGLRLADPEKDIAHLAALYDSEIHYVDRAIGELLAAFDPEVLANTLVVLTADHGEELFDHGGWKHGQTLYQEQIHVPLIWRWDRGLPAGRRLAGTVQLVDLLPTLVAAAGGEAAAAWQGQNLLPALRGDGKLARRPAFAQHLASGPLRAATIFEGRKLVLFDREAPFTPANGLIEHLWRLDVARMVRRELFDLGQDPGEHANLAARDQGVADRLEPIAGQRLDRTHAGLRVMVSGLEGGERLSGRIELAAQASAWRSYFLAPGDRVTLEGTVLSFDLGAETAGAPLEKGFWLEGEPAGIREIRARISPVAPLAIAVGPGRAYRGGALAAAELESEHRPEVSAGRLLRIWRRTISPSAQAGIDPEVEQSLKALGYIE